MGCLELKEGVSKPEMAPRPRTVEGDRPGLSVLTTFLPEPGSPSPEDDSSSTPKRVLFEVSSDAGSAAAADDDVDNPMMREHFLQKEKRAQRKLRIEQAEEWRLKKEVIKRQRVRAVAYPVFCVTCLLFVHTPVHILMHQYAPNVTLEGPAHSVPKLAPSLPAVSFLD